VSAKGRDNGIRSVLKNRLEKECYETKSLNGVHYFILKARNNQEIGRSRSFKTVIALKKQLNYLQKDSKQNKTSIIELSQQYDMVSDFTSLIVLENLAQYVEHKIAPPKSLSKMRSDYFAQIEVSKKDKEKVIHDKISQVINMWETRKQWWKKEFPKYVAPKPVKTRQRFDNEEGAELERVVTTGSHIRASDLEEADAVYSVAREESPAPVTMQADMKKEKASDSTNASVQISEWNPDTPYLKALENAKDKTVSYYSLKKDYYQSPAFYFDTSNYFFKNNNQDFALQILSNIAELKIQDSRLLRTMAMALKQQQLFDLSIWAYRKVLEERSEEPQSYRDLALALQQRIDAGKSKSIKQDYKQAIELLYKVVTDRWDRFNGIEVTVLMEINQMLPKIYQNHIDYSFIDTRLIQLMDVDLRITLAWDSDMTDIDLWVIEPSGEKVTYSKTLSTVGGMFHQDFTGGYGPEEYLLHKAPLGNYTIKVHFYGNGSPELTGGTTLYVDVFTNFGRPNQKRQTLSLRLEKAEDDFLVGTIAID
jgi:tetratricopeptide (TPR) repeat protein